MEKIEISKPNNISMSAIDHSANLFEKRKKHYEVADFSTTLSSNKSHKSVGKISSLLVFVRLLRMRQSMP